MEKYDCSMRIGVNVDASELDKTEAQLKRIVDLLKRINKPRRITITDGDGNLRCALGPLSVEPGYVFIKNATVQNAIFSANKKDAAGNNRNNNADSYYDELNKKLDYIISLMPVLQF